MVPLHRLPKAKIIWLQQHKCQHRHTYLEHYKCYLQEQPDEHERLGFLDIEASNLDADYGIMLSWCIKDGDSDSVLSDVMTPQDVKRGIEDKRIVKSCIEAMLKFDRIVTYYGCLTPEHRVLTDELKWIPVGELKPGQGLIAFSEHSSLTERRKWEHSRVVANIPIQRPCLRVHLSDGTSLTATTDHPFLASMPGNPGQYQWINTRDLKPGSKLRRLIPTWEQNTSYEAGWLAGFYDGEGNINQGHYTNSYAPEGKYTFDICATQKHGIVLEQAKRFLEICGFNWRSSNYDRNHTEMAALSIAGDTRDRLRFLGAVRPTRLFNKFNPTHLNSIKNFGEKDFLEVISIEDMGVMEVAGLETTSKTYISEGFGSHNTGFDLPFLRARALIVGVDFPSYGSLKHKDLYYVIRNKFKLSSRRLENACRQLLGATDKTRIDAKYWRNGVRGDIESLKYILEHNVYDVLDLEKLYKKCEEFSKVNATSI